MEEELRLPDSTEAVSAQATSCQKVPQYHSTVVSSVTAVLGWELAGGDSCAQKGRTCQSSLWTHTFPGLSTGAMRTESGTSEKASWRQ